LVRARAIFAFFPRPKRREIEIDRASAVSCSLPPIKKQKLAIKKVKKVVDTGGRQEYNGKAVAQEGTLKKGLGQQRNLEKRTA